MLFPITVTEHDIPAIAGLSYVAAYLSEALEVQLEHAIDESPWDRRWQRRIQPYGGAYGQRRAASPIPSWGADLAARIVADGLVKGPLDQMLVNEYLPGQGIAFHRNYDQYDDTVVSLSLLSAYVMDFRHPAENRKERLLLERRSLLVLDGKARHEWEHGIAHRKNDIWHEAVLRRDRRLSITFRTLKKT